MKKVEDLSLVRLTAIRSEVEGLIAENRKSVGSGQDIRTIEEGLLSKILDIGRLLLQDRIIEEENKLEKTGYNIVAKKKNKAYLSRQYVSLFGEFRVTRKAYHIDGVGNYYPLDEHLKFPHKKLSYSLQSLLAQNSTEQDYRESVRILNSLLPLNIKGGQVKRLVEDLGPVVEEYYTTKPRHELLAQEEEGSFLAFGNDGKGVPIVKRERDDQPNGEEARLMKGKKRGTKKQATVSVSFSFNARVRQSEDILRGLFREASPENVATKDEKDRRFSLNVHKRAFMCNQKKGIDYAIENLTRRNPTKHKTVIALVDCGPGLEEGILASIKNHGLEQQLDAIIADIVHVSEYVWKAANAILGEKYIHRSSWVRQMMKDLLESKTQKVIDDLTANVEKTKLSATKKKQVEKTIKYLTNHQHKMDYKTYLAKGYPISTGLIEACCGHLIKDRMERSGMRWTMKGAQDMIDLRAVKKNQDWESFMTFIKNKNTTQKLQLVA